MAMQDTGRILQEWPKDIGQTDLKSLGLDRPEVLKRLQDNRNQIMEFTLASQTKSNEQLTQVIAKISSDMERVSTLMQDGEKQFMAGMKVSAPKLAKSQNRLETELAKLSKVGDLLESKTTHAQAKVYQRKFNISLASTQRSLFIAFLTRGILHLEKVRSSKNSWRWLWRC